MMLHPSSDKKTYAQKIINSFWNEYDCERTPPLVEITPLARRLISLTENETDDMANVRQSLIDWLDAPRQKDRAWNIRAAAKHLADMVLERPQ